MRYNELISCRPPTVIPLEENSKITLLFQYVKIDVTTRNFIGHSQLYAIISHLNILI